ncbi:MAG: minor capsid protein [Dorea sp.]|jgi:SPP1 gp7 family putative phage head morphogenesis protein|nr:minor capsid protein [Dorea sp.]
MDSREYWKHREREQLKHNITEETEYRKCIWEIYDYMMDQIQREINGFYVKYAKKEGITLSEARKRVSKLDIEEYGRKAAKYVKEKDFSDVANEEMRLYNATMKINRLEMLKANIGLELVDGFNELQKYFDRVLTKRTLDEFERQAGILGDTVGDCEKAAHAIVNASFHNASFSDRIWMYQDMMKAELSKLLQVGLIQGKHPGVLARHLVKLFGVRRSDAERLMQTELARVQTEAQKRSFERNGYDRYEFIALETACKVCKAINGKHFKVKDMMPGENAPPMHPNCRCSTAAYMDREEFERWLSEKENVVKSDNSDTIKILDMKEDNNVAEIRGLGRINTALLEKEFGKIQTDRIIVTNERLLHIQERHPQDYELFEKYGQDSVQNPDYIIRDMKNKGTVFMVKKLPDTNLNVVVRVVLDTDKNGLQNSVMTFYRIRERNLRKMIEKNTLLYKKE